jgi:hypothetical protein
MWSDEERRELKRELLAKVVKVDNPLGPPCWIWMGVRGAFGYGQMAWRKTTNRVHRLSYIAFIRPIPEGLSCLHHCDNRLCINPTHLHIGTAQDNTDDMVSRGRHRSVTNQGNQSFTDKQIAEMKFLALEGYPQEEIARIYNSTQGYISQLKLGLYRADIEPVEPEYSKPTKSHFVRRL